MNENFLQSARVALLRPTQAVFGQTRFSDVGDHEDKSPLIEYSHFPKNRIHNLGHVLSLSASSFKNEKFATTIISLPVNVARRVRLQVNMGYDWQVKKMDGNAPYRFHISDYNINASRLFKLSKDFSLKLTGLYSSIGFLPAY